MKTLIAVMFNVLFIYNGEVMVGEVVRTSGNMLYVKPCGSTAIGNIALPKRDAIPVKLSCREFLRDSK